MQDHREQKLYDGLTVDQHLERIKKGPERKIFEMGLKNIITHDEKEIKTWAAIDYVDAIDKVVSEIYDYLNKRRKFSRQKWILMTEDIFVEYGIWSRIINISIRDMIKITAQGVSNASSEDIGWTRNIHNSFSWAYAYWWNRTHYIKKVIMSKSRLGGISKKKKIAKMARTLKLLIKGELDPKSVSKEFNQRVLNIKQYVTELTEIEK